MARKKQETLVLFPEVMAITKKFTDEQFGVLMRAAFAYRFSGEVYSGDDPVVDVGFQAVASQIDRYKEFCNTLSNNAKCSNGKQSAAKYSKTQQSDPPIHVQSMSYPCPIQSIESEADKPPSTPPLGKYQNVFLSENQLEELRTDFPSDWDKRIERLSEYLEVSGKQYKNHLATIRMWAKEESPAKTERSERECTMLTL